MVVVGVRSMDAWLGSKYISFNFLKSFCNPLTIVVILGGQISWQSFNIGYKQPSLFLPNHLYQILLNSKWLM